MHRREFLLSSLAFGALSVRGHGAHFPRVKEGEQEYLELIKYHLRTGSKKNLVSNFYRDVAIPALNRIGISPIGVFNAKYGANSSTLYVLIPHKSIDSAVTAFSRLLEDTEFNKAGASFLDAPLSDPAFIRMETSLLLAFSYMPRLEVLVSLIKNKSRIYELRVYESHSRKAGKKKIEMFNKGGEIETFQKAGLQSVFFGETIFGPRMPNLTYMLVFENMAVRNQKWDSFGTHPDWLKLRANPIYKDTVSNITDIILQPRSFSQI